MAPGQLAPASGLPPGPHAVVRPVPILRHERAPLVGDGRFSRAPKTGITAPRGELQQRPRDSCSTVGEPGERLACSDLRHPATALRLRLLLVHEPIAAQHRGLQEVVARIDPVQNVERGDGACRTPDHVERTIDFDQARYVRCQGAGFVDERRVLPQHRQMCQCVNESPDAREAAQARDRQADRAASEIEMAADEHDDLPRHPFVGAVAGHRRQVGEEQRASRQPVVQRQVQRLWRSRPPAGSDGRSPKPARAMLVLQRVPAQHVSDGPGTVESAPGSEWSAPTREVGLMPAGAWFHPGMQWRCG